MRIDLGSRQALVAEQLLDDAQVGTALEQVCRERVAQGVWRHPGWKAREPAEPVQPSAKTANAEWSAPVVQEQLGPLR